MYTYIIGVRISANELTSARASKYRLSASAVYVILTRRPCLHLSAAEKLRAQEDLFRLRAMRKEGEQRREHLLDKAKQLQERANKHKAKVSQAVSPPRCHLVQICRKR